jgi:bifunctional DNA-binding transcriptional regulator/antitoxin component of YhaV-PrlF toxin-antitoxin module
MFSSFTEWLGRFIDRGFYFLLGVALALFVVATINKQKKKKHVEKIKAAGNVNHTEDLSDRVRFFVNIFVLNKSEVVKAQVESKFKNFRLLGKIAGNIAGRVVTDKAFIEKIAGKFAVLIPEKLREEIGVTAEVELVFQQDSFMVIAVDILAADARKLIEKKGGSEKLKVYDSWMHTLNLEDYLNKPISDQLVTMVGEKLMEQLPLKIAERMKEAAGLEVEVYTRSEADQSRFFYSALKGMKGA